MATPIIIEEIPVAEVIAPPYEDAARLLEQALQSSGNDAQVAYMLALAYKRLGKVAEARSAFGKINKPDANVLLQLGLLSLQEKQYAQAEQELERARQMDPASFVIGYNLCVVRLTLGRLDECTAQLPAVMALAADPREKRFLLIFQKLLAGCLRQGEAGQPDVVGRAFQPDVEGPAGAPQLEAALGEMTSAEEQRLVGLLRGIDQFEVVYPILQALAAARPNSLPVQEAVFEAALVQGKKLCDRCEWSQASRLLAPLARSAGENRSIGRQVQAACLNLLGCCACMEQDFERGVNYLTSASRLAGQDGRVSHNLALAHEWLHELDQAEPHWNRFLDQLDRRVPSPPDLTSYVDNLAFETLNHLAEAYTKKERWPAALNYLLRAQKIRPRDADLLERVFHLYTQLKRHEEARRALYRLRQVRPNDPQLDLYELDLHETKSLDDLDRVLNDIGRILKKYPNDLRVEERAVGMVGNVIPLMGRLCDQLTEQMAKIVDQVRHLPNYQINWSAVREVMRDLEDEFLRLRQITRLCLPLVNTDEHRRIVRDLSSHIDRKIDDCRRLGRD
jgi:Flp pilus assembly protein TadD